MNTARNEVTLESAATLFLLRCDAESTRVAYGREITRFLGWLGPNPPRVGTCERYVAHLRGRGLSPTTVRWRATVAASFLRSAWEQEILDHDPTRGFKPPKGTGGFAPRFLSERDLKKLLRGPDRRSHIGKRDLAILVCLGVGGLRAGEVCRLTYGDVEFHRGRVLLRVNGKGRKLRLVSLDGDAMVAVRKWVEVVPRDTAPSSPLFTAWQRPARLTVAGLNHILAKNCERAGLAKITAHALRHTAATLALEAGMRLHRVRDLLGHSSVLVTSKYLHVVGIETNRVLSWAGSQTSEGSAYSAQSEQPFRSK